jgi:hypothetical protein
MQSKQKLVNDQRFLPGDRVRLNEKGFDWWGFDEETYHIADNTFEIRECVDDPKRGRLYLLADFPYPVPEDELAFEDEEE